MLRIFKNVKGLAPASSKHCQSKPVPVSCRDCLALKKGMHDLSSQEIANFPCLCTSDVFEAGHATTAAVLRGGSDRPNLGVQKMTCDSGNLLRKHLGSLAAPPGHGPRSTPGLSAGSLVG
mmetsp:Transcript_55223/g.142263  ORF Transcript_55223/g.142263 Transcript_55223/m.142263 type:complete len:120 (-) Transcript_55223:75-434(-)